MITSVIRELDIKKLVFIGSSKGGYSALNFSFYFDEVNVCIAAPQYHLGSYLNCEKFHISLKSIVGSISDESISILDNRLSKIIKSSKLTPKHIYLHISRQEHTYKDHCVDLIADLQTVEIPLDIDFADYENHNDLIYYYPNYLKSVLKVIL